MRAGLGYTLWVAVVAAAVTLVGASLAPGAREAVAVGAVLAFATQVAMFWLLFVWLLPGRFLLAYGVGVVGRFLVVLVTAVVGVQLSGLAAAPTLFALVGVLFVSTVVEPFFLKTNSPTGS